MVAAAILKTGIDRLALKREYAEDTVVDSGLGSRINCFESSLSEQFHQGRDRPSRSSEPARSKTERGASPVD
jgi:hypothetical protein